MKSKLLSLLVIVAMFIGTIITPVHAAGLLAIKLDPDSNIVTPGGIVTIKISVSNLQADGGTKFVKVGLEFDDNIFELATGDSKKDIVGLNKFTPFEYNPTEKIILFQRSSYINEPTDLGTISLKVKDNVAIGNYNIKTVNSDSADKSSTLSIKETETTIQVKNISVKPEAGYRINDDKITGVTPDTTIDELKGNIIVKGGGTVAIEDKNGNPVTSGKAATGMVVKTSEGNYTIAVKGDLNGDGEIDISDTIAMKMHHVKIENAELKGVYLEAADMDENGTVSIRDLAILVEYQIGICDINGNQL